MVTAQEILIPFRRLIPATILNKFVIRTQIHCKSFPASGTTGDQLGGNAHVLLPLDHVFDSAFIIPGFLAAGLRTLEQTIIPLGVYSF